VADGITPDHSGDHSIPRHTFWPHLGTKEWLLAEFDRPRTVSRISVYWFDDEGVGHCRFSKASKALYRQGDAWKPITLLPGQQNGTTKDKPDRIRFATLTTTAIRIEVELRKQASGGILELEIDEYAKNHGTMRPCRRSTGRSPPQGADWCMR